MMILVKGEILCPHNCTNRARQLNCTDFNSEISSFSVFLHSVENVFHQSYNLSGFLDQSVTFTVTFSLDKMTCLHSGLVLARVPLNTVEHGG